ncbi:hypothetical protein Tco_0962826 [Tanacetum coccineum]
MSSLSESASVYFEWGYWLRLSEYADTLLSLLPNLLNMPPFFFLAFCLGDLDRSRLILDNTLGLGYGLRERLDLCLMSYSLALIVLDSEYHDIPEHPPKLSRAFTSFSFSFLSFSLLNFSAMIGSSWDNSCRNTPRGLHRTRTHLGLAKLANSLF